MSKSGALAFFMAILLLAGGCGREQPPRAVHGVLDLSGWDWQRDGAVVLDGEWEFHWQRLLEPGDFRTGKAAPTGFIDVPGAWNGYQTDKGGLPGAGYATYRLRVRLPEGSGRLALHVPWASTAYRLWVDGELLAANGRTGTNAAASTPQELPTMVSFLPTGPETELIIQVSNFQHSKGGLRKPIRLGPAAEVSQSQFVSMFLQTLLVDALLLAGLFHLVLYVLRREPVYYYFSLFSFLMGARMLVVYEMILIRLWPDFNFQLQLKIEYVTAYVALPAFYHFGRTLFPHETSQRLVRAVTLVGGTLAAFAILTPAAVFTRTASLLYPFLMVGILYLSYVAVWAIRNRRENAWLFLGGNGSLSFLIIIDVLNQYRLAPSSASLPNMLGLLALMFQSLILARWYAVTFTRQEMLAEKNAQLLATTRQQLDELRAARRLLTDREEHLRKEIAEMLHGRVQTRLLMSWHHLGQALNLWESHPEQAKTLVADSREEVDRVREEDVRQVSHLLHPSIIEVGLLPAVESLAGRFGGQVRVSLQADEALQRLDTPADSRIPESIRLAVYRVLEEALNNSCLHGQAAKVDVSLSLDPEGRLCLWVRDDGRGFDPDQMKPGLGLRSLAARVGEMGGDWAFSGRPGQGAELTVRLPLGYLGEATTEAG